MRPMKKHPADPHSEYLRLLRLRPRPQPGFRRGRARARAHPRHFAHRPRLWRRQSRADGRDRALDPAPWRPRHRHHSRLLERARAYADRGPGADRGRRHASAEAADVRQVGCLRRAAGRPRHAGRIRRAAHLDAARPPHEADRARQYRGLLEPAARAVRPHERRGVHPPGARAQDASWSTRSRRSSRRSRRRSSPTRPSSPNNSTPRSPPSSDRAASISPAGSSRAEHPRRDRANGGAAMPNRAARAWASPDRRNNRRQCRSFLASPWRGNKPSRRTQDRTSSR